MRSAKWITAALLSVVATTASAQEPGFDSRDFDFGNPVLAYNLAVVPLYTRKAPPYDDYTVLEEAQAAKKVVIRELAEQQVDKLQVRNRDSRPLYLLGGEVVLGGQQDRMVVSDTVVDPAKLKQIDVRCVEAGRWNGADLSFHASQAIAHPELRRLALFSDQTNVWSEVARKSASANVSSSTGTYRRVLQDAAVRKRIAGYLDEIQGQLGRTDRLAGLAVAINGEMEVVDLFDSPPLYSKLERKLLASYVLAALEKQPGSEAKRKEIETRSKSLKKKDLEDFMGGTQQAPSTAKSGSVNKVFRHNGKAVHGTYFGTQKVSK